MNKTSHRLSTAKSILFEHGHRNSGSSHEKWWIFPLQKVSSPEGIRNFRTSFREHRSGTSWIIPVRVGGWALHLWKIWVRQLGLLFPLYGKIKMIQTTKQPKFSITRGFISIKSPLISLLNHQPPTSVGYPSKSTNGNIISWGNFLYLKDWTTLIPCRSDWLSGHL